MPGLHKLLRGILKYRREIRPGLLEQFERVRDNPEPKAVMFSCIDSRLILTRLLGSQVGDMFLVRNAGNLVPHADKHSAESVSTEPGALELGCIINNIKHVIVCGHSDCKAMNALYNIRDQIKESGGGPLQMWLKRHGTGTVAKYEKINALKWEEPLEFEGETPKHTFKAYIDPENKFAVVDKFSQINTLEQLQNIASHPFLKEKLETGKVKLHALWFDVYTGEFYMFSRDAQRYITIDEDSFENLISEGESDVDKKQ